MLNAHPTRNAAASVVETDDPDRVHEILNRTYARMRLAVVDDRCGLRLTQHEFGPLVLQHVDLRMGFTAHVPPMGMITVGRTLRGTAERESGRDVVTTGPGDLAVVGRPDQDLRARIEDQEAEFARFTPDVFAAIVDGAPRHVVRFSGYRPVSAQAADIWNRTYDFVRATAAGLADGADPLLVGTTVRLLAAAALTTFPNTAVHEPGNDGGRDAHPATLRRAIAFIDDNADRDIAPADIAAAARVRIRTLQVAFRRHLDTTPTAYLRRVRLEQAHRELLAADPRGTTVTAVARRWGFPSHSRFTADYRATYGRIPSETLRRGGAPAPGRNRGE